MIALLQRVTHSEVRVNDRVIAAVDRGLLVFVAVERHDREIQAQRLCERLLKFRVFPDEQGRMNLSVEDVGGGLLLVPQFTLAADTGRGSRASFAGAAEPDKGRQLFDEFVRQARQRHGAVQTGQFGADMQVALTNDGPVTFWLRAAPDKAETI